MSEAAAAAPLPAGSLAAGARRQRLAPDARRGQIFSCAQRLFAEKSYEDVSATDIAAAAGVARGLVNHYFGTKRELYLAVVRLNATVPEVMLASLPEGSLEHRIDVATGWFLDALEHTGGTWLASGSAGMGRDPDLERILVDAENESVDRLIGAFGLGAHQEQREQIRAMFRVYAQLARSGGREWLLRKTLSKAQVHALLATTLLAIVRDAVPAITADPAPGHPEPGSARPAQGST